jgi:hypothetical protein
VAGLVENFWAAGYVNVIAGSFLRRYSDYVSFRQLLRPSAVFLIDLLVDKDVRDHRRITRAKQTTQEWRDMEGYSRTLFVMPTLPGTAACLHEGWPVSRKDVVTTQRP